MGSSTPICQVRSGAGLARRARKPRYAVERRLERMVMPSIDRHLSADHPFCAEGRRRMKRCYEVIFCRSIAWPILLPGDCRYTPLIQTVTVMFDSELANEKHSRNHAWQQAMRHPLAKSGWTCASPQLMTLDEIGEYNVLIGKHVEVE